MSRWTPTAMRIIICVDCTVKINSTIQRAKRHGWAVWVGGARCKACGEKLQKWDNPKLIGGDDNAQDD